MKSENKVKTKFENSNLVTPVTLFMHINENKNNYLTNTYLGASLSDLTNEPPYHNYHFCEDAQGRDDHAFESTERLYFVSPIRITMYHTN